MAEANLIVRSAHDIPAEHHSKIFECFHRVSGASHFTRLGIGLYVSFEIIKRHSGKIWVESHSGKGSAFHFTVPATDFEKTGK